MRQPGLRWRLGGGREPPGAVPPSLIVGERGGTAVVGEMKRMEESADKAAETAEETAAETAEESGSGDSGPGDSSPGDSGPGDSGSDDSGSGDSRPDDSGAEGPDSDPDPDSGSTWWRRHPRWTAGVAVAAVVAGAFTGGWFAAPPDHTYTPQVAASQPVTVTAAQAHQGVSSWPTLGNRPNDRGPGHAAMEILLSNGFGPHSWVNYPDFRPDSQTPSSTTTTTRAARSCSPARCRISPT